MSCSKDSTVNDIVKKGLADPTLKIDGVPTSRTTDYIDYVTGLAKDKYNVDMGPLFTLSFKQVQRGISSNTYSVAYLRPNEEAFEAIDRSKAMEQMAIEKELEIEKNKAFRNQLKEFDDLQREGNYQVIDGEVLPAVFNTGNLPDINIQC